jgi:hypothetical protein
MKKDIPFDPNHQLFSLKAVFTYLQKTQSRSTPPQQTLLQVQAELLKGVRSRQFLSATLNPIEVYVKN